MDSLILKNALTRVQIALKSNLTEDEIERLFTPVYEALGYQAIGVDIKGKPKGRAGFPDVLLLDSVEGLPSDVFVVVELKRPSEDLERHTAQLFKYLNELNAPWGLLSNGYNTWIYQRKGKAIDRVGQYSIQELTQKPEVLAPLEKRLLYVNNFAQVKARVEAAKESGMSLLEIEDVSSTRFIQTFALEENTPFGALVWATQDLLVELLDQSKFVEGSYDFWKRLYARELSEDDVPKVWMPFLKTKGKEDIYRFMFSLETAYTLTARLILAKAVEDQDRERNLSQKVLTEVLLDYIRTKENARTGELIPTVYLDATQALFNAYAQSLFTSVYAQDIFDWWRDWDMAPKSQNRFATALGSLLFSLIGFSFENAIVQRMGGDFLGELYQAYFDPDTRKALGEFYTPPAVVEFILDEVGYDGEGRLLDPATGSGTFLIRALKRFLKTHANRDPEATLKKLTEEFMLVAFDINPFAVLMAQVNFAAHLVPLYAKAVKKNPKLVLRRLPVVRTDSLRQEPREEELREKGGMVQLDFGDAQITTTIELPVKVNGKNLEVKVRFPRLETLKRKKLVRNSNEWLLALQQLFAAVESLSQAFDDNKKLPNLRSELRRKLAEYFSNSDPLAGELLSYAEEIWKTLETLKTQHGDGRFLKTLEDLVLGLILKHDMRYQYVVGNPPYVRIQNLPEELRRYWENLYDWAEGNFDIFIPFIERALSNTRPWLETEGVLGYIVPNRFQNAEYGARLRSQLPSVARIRSITDFKAVTFAPPETDNATRLFKEAMVYPSILIAERDPQPKKPYTFKTARFYPKPTRLQPAKAIEAVQQAYKALNPKKKEQKLTLDKDEYADVFLQDSSVLNGRGWYLMPKAEREVFEALEKLGDQLDPALDARTSDQKRRLYNYTATRSGGFQGIATGLDSVMVLKELERDEKEGLLLLKPKGGGEAVWLEQAALKPFLFGKDVERWNVSWNGWWVIFPYFNHKGRFWFMPSSEYWDFKVTVKRGKSTITRRVFEGWPEESPMIDKKYPKLWEYLKANETGRPGLRERENGRYKQGRVEEFKWYEIAYPRSLEPSSRPKIVAQLLASSVQFANDNEGSFLIQGGGKGGGVYGISIRESVSSSIILGLLNSRVADFFFRTIGTVYSGGFHSYADAFLKWLPIPKISKFQEKRIGALAEGLTANTAQLRSLQSQIAQFPKSVSDLLREEGKLPDLFPLSELASHVGQLPSNIRADAVTSSSQLDGDEALQIGRGSVAFKPWLARLVFETIQIRGSIEREEFLGLEFPEREKAGQKYLEKLKEWRLKVAKLEKAIAKAEAELNAAVYKLYGLDKSAQKVIEDYLERF